MIEPADEIRAAVLSERGRCIMWFDQWGDWSDVAEQREANRAGMVGEDWPPVGEFDVLTWPKDVPFPLTKVEHPDPAFRGTWDGLAGEHVTIKGTYTPPSPCAHQWLLVPRYEPALAWCPECGETREAP